MQRQVSPPDPDLSTLSSCRIHFHRGNAQILDEDESDDCLERARIYVAGGGTRTVTLHGYASVEGPVALNVSLAQLRAERIHRLLIQRGVPESSIVVAGHGPDMTYSTRESNRRVEVVLSETMTFDPEVLKVAKFKCGPDVTAQVQHAIDLTRTTFSGRWTADQRDEACEALRSVDHGEDAWDIVELHNNAWILSYRPLCATQGASPPCGSTVQVGTDCHYAGSANYVIIGAMCKLCYDHFYSTGRAGSMPGYTGYMDFDEGSMVDLIDLYKSSSANVGPSKAWARAGYRGRPTTSGPSGDRPTCAPECVQPYSGSDFQVQWYPHMVHETVR